METPELFRLADGTQEALVDAGRYLFASGAAVVFGWVYRSEERVHGLSLPGAVLLMHAYVGYAVLWYIAGWRAVGRVILGHTGWTKTDRVAEPAPTDRLSRAGSTR